MKLSTKGKYGIHAMFDLAQHDDGTPQPLKAIAERQSVPVQYLEQLLGVLRKEGLVQSARGVLGGYMLSRAAGEITVGQVLRALEGPLAAVECLEDGCCDKADSCATRIVWQTVQEGINGIVDSITLQDMVNNQKRLDALE